MKKNDFNFYFIELRLKLFSKFSSLKTPLAHESLGLAGKFRATSAISAISAAGATASCEKNHHQTRPNAKMG